ncbi:MULTISPECIES: glycosyltransferase family 2 protein [unclassified Paenibacillus]|uniref:glycosyltransferase family 2 protein n=1 Tax=unclassified Paenibacillus TaxID=185978 RepID=UPI00363EC5A0
MQRKNLLVMRKRPAGPRTGISPKLKRKRFVRLKAAGARGRGKATGLRKRRVRGLTRRPLAAGSVRISSAAFQAGFRAGLADAAHLSIEHEGYQKKALNRHWVQRARSMRWIGPPWRRYMDASKGYVRGFFRGKKQHAHDWLMLPTTQSVAAIVTVMNEERTIGSIMDQLNRLPFDEVFVIVNGSVDQSFHRARGRSHAVILSYPEPLGHDVGRALGAKLAQSDILLFLDGDILLSAEAMIPFIGGIECGLDVALNNITPYMRVFANRDSVTYIKQFLNASLGRPDLEANSMTAVPHALSRKAVTALGVSSLMVPPKAQALAVHHGLRIGISGSVDVISSNKRRTNNTGKGNRVADLIIGDHLEALKLAGELAGNRLAFVDSLRNRAKAGGEA